MYLCLIWRRLTILCCTFVCVCVSYYWCYISFTFHSLLAQPFEIHTRHLMFCMLWWKISLKLFKRYIACSLQLYKIIAWYLWINCVYSRYILLFWSIRKNVKIFIKARKAYRYLSGTFIQQLGRFTQRSKFTNARSSVSKEFVCMFGVIQGCW